MLHIAFRPLIISAFAMKPGRRPLSAGLRATVYGLSALASAVILLQLDPFGWAGPCTPGAILCADRRCTVSGAFQGASEAPDNGLLAPVDAATGRAWGLHSDMLAAFLLPLVHGAWRFVLVHAIARPVLAGQRTANPNEILAV